MANPIVALEGISLSDPLSEAKLPVAGPGQIDWPALLERYSGRLNFIEKLAAMALESHGDTAAKLRAAAASDDLDTLRFLDHKLKSVGGNFAALPLATLANETEAATKLGSNEASHLAGKLAGELATALELLLAELADRLQRGT